MVRAGVIKYPSEWPHGGYREVLKSLKRYSIIDQKALINKCGLLSKEQFRDDYQGWVGAATSKKEPLREPVWSESVAVGGKEFIENIKENLGIKAKGRETAKRGEGFVLNVGILSLDNMYSWDVCDDIPSS